jgi:hypothetical protein
MGAERKCVTEDREIFDDFTQAVKTSQSLLGYHNRRVCRKDSTSLPACSRIITDPLQSAPGQHAPTGARINHKPDYLKVLRSFDCGPDND